MPLFSVVTPVYNRAALVGRCIESVLRQPVDDWELILVDDGSTDDSVSVMRSYADPRIRVIVSDANRGIGPSRNTGIDASTGEWIICLDSDDEFTPDALQTVSDYAQRVDPSVSRMRFLVQRDDGVVCPVPPPDEAVWDYAGYLCALNALRGSSESLCVDRRESLDAVRYPQSRAHEFLFHLDYAQRFTQQLCKAVIRYYHQDSTNATRHASDPARIRREAHDHAVQVNTLLARHGDALKRHAPRIYTRQLREAARMNLLSGVDRKAGWRCLWRYAVRRPLDGRTPELALFGLLGPAVWSTWISQSKRYRRPVRWRR